MNFYPLAVLLMSLFSKVVVYYLIFNCCFFFIFYFFTATGCCSLLEQTGLYSVLIQYHVSEPVYGLALVAHNIEVLFS